MADEGMSVDTRKNMTAMKNDKQNQNASTDKMPIQYFKL